MGGAPAVLIFSRSRGVAGARGHRVRAHMRGAAREASRGPSPGLGAKVGKAASTTSDRTAPPAPVTPPRPARCVTGELAHHTAAHRELTPPRTATAHRAAAPAPPPPHTMAEAMVKKEAMAPPPAKIRKKNTAVCCPLVYGSVAFWLGRKADEYHTHKWTLFVRGPHGEDLGYFVEKVVFKLHPSFAQPVREIHEPPYEVTEKGWGEFEASVRVHFRDPSERPVEFSHVVKLYDGTTPQVATQPVVSEVYDEVVFTEPHEALYDRAMARSGPPPAGHPLNENFSRFDDAPEMETLLRAGEYVRGQLHSVKDAIARLDHQIGLARQMEQSRQAQEQHAAQQAQQQAQQRQESRASSRKPASPRRAADAPPDAAAPPPKPATAPPPAAS